MKIWQGSAPSNIALIKYMGKMDMKGNRPTNSSLSYTLKHLRTYVELERTDKRDDVWEPLVGEFQVVDLSDKGKQRYLRHLSFLKKRFDYDGAFVVRSTNGFPSDCGLASSASSFAALTLVACQALSEETGIDLLLEEIVDLSRQGSGSSCRSFMQPWVEWNEQRVDSVDGIPYKNLEHLCVVVDSGKKKVSSSAAHIKVLQSSLFDHRIYRAENRLMELKNAFIEKDWQKAFDVTWAEFWDMHALFETSNPPFGYMTSDSISVLNQIRDYWQDCGDGPLVTMDAGANVHLLFREDQQEDVRKLQELFSQNWTVINSRNFDGNKK